MGRDILMRWFLLLLLLVLLPGCAPEKAEKKPERILSLSAAATHILTRLGTPPAAIDEYGRIAAGKNPPPVIGKGSAVSLEKIAELRIDCAVLWYYQTDAEKLFRSKGIRVEKIAGAPRLSGYAELIRKLGKLTGKEAAAEKLALEFEAARKTLPVPETGIPQRVYFELYSVGKAVSDESYIGELIRASGGRCIVRRTGLAGMETVVEAAPETIFYVEGFGDAKEIASRPGFASFPAVRNGKIFAVPRRLIVEGAAPLEAIAYFKQKLR